jgi:geranylgeranyl reductase family protein
MLDVIIAGAGPAGSVAALVLARAGARVLLLDRETFPRDKLCGDTVNPGAVARLRALGLEDGGLATARPLAGMRVSGPTATVTTSYGDGRRALALTRRALDAWLLDAAIAAGARFESGLVVREPLVDDTHGRPLVRGLCVSRGPDAPTTRLPAMITIAADGRRSTLAHALGLMRHPTRPRRWAYGTYATGVTGTDDYGEMHIRPRWYAGVAPLADGIVNLCIVTEPEAGEAPMDVVTRTIARDTALRDRFASAAFESDVRVLGPLASDARGVGADGLLLAGDAAGFVDPLTGDGVRLAIESAELAAHEALRAIETGDMGAALVRLSFARRRAFGRKLSFNRMLRWMVGSPAAVGLADLGARVAPGLVRQAVRYAGDVA